MCFLTQVSWLSSALLLVCLVGGYDPQPIVVASGSAIGNKRILYFQSGSILLAQSVIVKATELYPAYTGAYWSNVAMYQPCVYDAPSQPDAHQ
jgi:hypothetical protein